MCFEERNLAKNLQKNGNFSAKFKFESVTFKMFKETLLLILSLAVISKTSQPEQSMFLSPSNELEDLQLVSPMDTFEQLSTSINYSKLTRIWNSF